MPKAIATHSSSRRIAGLASLIALLWLAGTSAQTQPTLKIDVIYPTQNQRIAAVDSQFIFGNVTPGATLTINGTSVPVYSNGAFLAFLPISSGRFTFRLEAALGGQKKTHEVAIIVPEPYRIPPAESTVIVPGYLVPSGRQTWMEGDLVNFAFRGTPGLKAYFRLSHDERLSVMTESPPAPQSYWAQALFGEGEVPDSLLVKGSFTGSSVLQSRHVSDSLTVTYYLCRTPLKDLDSKERGFKRQLETCGCVTRESDAVLTVWPQDKIVVGELKDSLQTLRVGPRKGYFSVFQPRGLRFRITGFANNSYRARLVEGQDVWIADTSLRLLPEGSRIPGGEFSLIRTRKTDGGVVITLNPGAKLPFDVEYDRLANRLYLRVYNCTSNIDWVRYDTSDSLIAAIRYDQPQTGVVELAIDLSRTLWGYDCYYDQTQLNLKLDDRPHLDTALSGLRIAVDPGHSPDPGAIGPTGFKEKDANLQIALELRNLLTEKGASVLMTREGDTPLALHDRAPRAYAFNADIFVSVHNNALPDGVNPFTNNGTSCFYYHPQSMELAETVHRRMVAATGYNDYGLWHGNFAVIRPTGYLSILVECAFMMLPEHEIDLQTTAFRHRIAQAIADGICDFIERERARAAIGK